MMSWPRIATLPALNHWPQERRQSGEQTGLPVSYATGAQLAPFYFAALPVSD
jgi:hypothetical protein